MTATQDLIEIQNRLQIIGLYKHRVDGLWGVRTRAAIHAAIDIAEKQIIIDTPIPTKPVVDFRLAMELASHEAIIRQAYKDSVGVWTWSVGLTSATGHRVERYIDNPQSLQRCLDIYVWALKNYAKQVDDVFADTNLSQAAYTGFVSFHWNTGAIKQASFVDLYKKGMMTAAESSFKQWNKSGGKVNKGLVIRRAKEADLIWRGIWSNDGRMTEFTRLTRLHTPVWASAIKISVNKELMQAFGNSIALDLDIYSQPDSVVTPTVEA